MYGNCFFYWAPFAIAICFFQSSSATGYVTPSSETKTEGADGLSLRLSPTKKIELDKKNFDEPPLRFDVSQSSETTNWLDTSNSQKVNYFPRGLSFQPGPGCNEVEATLIALRNSSSKGENSISLAVGNEYSRCVISDYGRKPMLTDTPDCDTKPGSMTYITGDPDSDDDLEVITKNLTKRFDNPEHERKTWFLFFHGDYLLINGSEFQIKSCTRTKQQLRPTSATELDSSEKGPLMTKQGDENLCQEQEIGIGIGIPVLVIVVIIVMVAYICYEVKLLLRPAFTSSTVAQNKEVRTSH